MAQAEELARQLLGEAEKKLSPRGFFLSLFSYKNRTDDAIECYQRAGNLFKLAKNWTQAGSSFLLAANLSDQQSNRCEAASSYVLASKCFDKFDFPAAINCLLNAIQIYTNMGRFVMAAKLHEAIADIYEQNSDLGRAIQHYEQAGDYFRVEENHSAAKKCLLKVAQYAASELEDYNRAISIYQEVAFFDLKSTILQYSARDNFFRALLCHLCVDVLNATYAMNYYVEKYPAFEISREFNFLKEIIGHVEEGDVDAFTKSVKQFDDLTRLDSWHTKLLLKIKTRIRNQPDLL